MSAFDAGMIIDAALDVRVQLDIGDERLEVIVENAINDAFVAFAASIEHRLRQAREDG